MVEHDDAMDRLRTSDPATGSHPDLHSLRDVVAQKAPASLGSDEVTRIHGDTLRGSRVRAPWIAAAAVVAIGLGAGGYALGLQQAETAPVADPVRVEPASPGLDLATEPLPRGGTALDGEESMSSEGGAADEDMAGEDMADEDYGMFYDPGPVRLLAGEDLPAGPGTGEVLATVSDQDPEEFATSLAEHLGMDAVPVPEAESWGYDATDLVDTQTGQVIHASIEGGPLNFHYESIFANEWCLEMFEGLTEEDMAVVQEDWARSYGPGMPLPDASSCRTPEGPAPSEEQAKAWAEKFFAGAGVDTSGFTVDVYAYDDSATVNIDYWPEGAQHGQLHLSAVVGPDGVSSAYGMVGELSSLGDYPVISAADAVDRYGTREWSMDYSVTIPEDSEPWLGNDMSMPSYELTEPTLLQPGDRIPLLLKDKTVTGAELVQGILYTPDNGELQVPVWKLLTDDGMHYAVLALADEALDLQSWE